LIKEGMHEHREKVEVVREIAHNTIKQSPKKTLSLEILILVK